MADIKNYGIKGVGANIQLGKAGNTIESSSGNIILKQDDGSLATISGANGTASSHFVTKAQLDALDAETGTGFAIELGDIDTSPGDGDWHITPDRGDYAGNTSVLRQGAVTSFGNDTKISTAIDKLNEATLNVYNNTFVRDVSFTTDVSQGGNPLTATLTISATGNPNRYDITWGDGDTTTATSDSTPSHTYTDNTNSPFNVTVRAYNNAGAGEGSEASHTETNFITLYTATPVADFELYTASSGGSALTGNDRHIRAGETIYLENTTTNSGSSTNAFEINWGDGSANSSVSAGAAGDVGQARLSHTYTADSGSSMHTITMQLTSHSSASPTDVPDTTTDSLKVYDASIANPTGTLTGKTISFGESSTGTSPRLASGYTDNSSEDSVSVGSSVTRITAASAGSTTTTTAMGSYVFDANSGTVVATIDGSAAGSRALTTGDDSGTYTSLVINEEADGQFLSATGTALSFSNSIYAPNLKKFYKAQISKTTSELGKGSHSFKLGDDSGDTNVLSFVMDDVTSTPTVDMSSASVAQASAGTLVYVSGVPYYTNDATLTLSGVSVYDWIGQTYRNDSTPFDVVNGTNFESTSGSAIGSNGYSYADVDGASTFLNSGTPVAETGKTSASPYALGAVTVNVNGGGTGVEQLKARMNNVNGNGSYAEFTGVKVQALNSNSNVVENAIAVSDSLGATFDDDGKRVTGFSGASDTPAIASSTNFYTANGWSGAETIAGTSEAVIRWGTLQHFDTDLSSGYLPAGPDLNTGRSGAQYFTFAFRRTAMANFTVTLTGTISGMFIAAPGTSIDSASTINGWLDCGTTYAGSGTPGADTGNGGNGSNGCAFTSGDRIIDGSAMSSDSFTFTLGDQNGTGATGNNILVRIKLEDGDSLTAISIA